MSRRQVGSRQLNGYTKACAKAVAAATVIRHLKCIKVVNGTFAHRICQ
jgi:hypothetical protein